MTTMDSKNMCLKIFKFKTMGRSVDYLNNARHVAYIDVDYPSEVEDEDGGTREPNEFDNEWHWDWFVETLMEAIPKGIKSLNDTYYCDFIWDGNETRIIFENKHCQIGLSEYFGLASVSIRVNEGKHGYGNDHVGLAEHWIDKVWPRIIKNLHELFGDNMLTKVGSFSNGEGVFKRMEVSNG